MFKKVIDYLTVTSKYTL